jgi:hypothetical protein
MDRQRIILTGTNLDLQGERMSLAQLETALKTINSARRPRLGLEHDMTLPPLGRISEAEIIQGDDGEFYLVAYQEYFDKEEIIDFDGETLVKEYFSNGGTSFAEVQFESKEQIRITIDPHNFQDQQGADNFFNELNSESEIQFEKAGLIRKALINDPELVFRLSETAIYGFFGYKIANKILKKTANKLADKISDDLAKIYDLIKKGIFKMVEKAYPKNRPITYIFEFPAKIHIELIVVDKNPQDILDCLSHKKLEKLSDKIDKLTDKFEAEKIQFELNKDLKWELNYLLTKNGESIGTKHSINKRNQVYKTMIENTIKRNKK